MMTSQVLCPKDLVEIVQLEQLIFKEEAFSQKQLFYLAHSKTCHFYVSKKKHQVLGYYMLLSRKNSAKIRLYSIAVNPLHQGKGMGKVMLKEVISIAKKMHKAAISLEVDEQNLKAIKLYQNHGFTTLGCKKNYYKNGNTALIMYKTI